MASATARFHEIIKVENSPEPERFVVKFAPPVPKPSPLALDPRDPENFLKRCSGHSKKTNLRCSATIGKKAQKEIHPTFLPTCAAHRDQQSLAGWCQFKQPDGERCARLLRWKPPYFELCDDHVGYPGTPCYFLEQLPLELRHEIYQYLIPTEPIGSSAAVIHHPFTGDMGEEDLHPYIKSYGRGEPRRSSRLVKSKFPMRLIDLLRVSRQVYDEVKDYLFRTITFKIDVRKDGTFMCGRRLLEPRREDGSSHLSADEVDHARRKFLKRFAWASVKNYTVDILLENWFHSGPQPPYHPADAIMNSRWDEEVELYDIRDYISVVVSGILAKAKKLHKLQVRLCLADFDWEAEQVLSVTKLLFGPFERLRNVRQPSLGGVFNGLPDRNSMYTVRRGTGCIRPAPPGYFKLCSVPSLPTDNPVLAPGTPEFDAYAAKWKRLISSEGSKNMIQDPPIQKMFTEFRNFYTDLAVYVPEVQFRYGKHSFLHRARVAREQEDVIAFRAIRTELIHYWHLYLEKERQKKQEMHARVARFLASDMYPSHVWNEPSLKQQQQHDSLPGRSAQSRVILYADITTADDTPTAGNLIHGDGAQTGHTPQPPHLKNHQEQQQLHNARRIAAHHVSTQPRNQAEQGYQQNSDAPQRTRHPTQTPNTYIDSNLNMTHAHIPGTDNSPSTRANMPSTSTSPPPRYQAHTHAHAPEDTNLVPAFNPSSSSSSSLYDAHLGRSGDPGPSRKKQRTDSGHLNVNVAANGGEDVVWGEGEGERQVKGESGNWYTGKGKGRVMSL
ncbi:hypothetical protein TW65_07414 [Stemphylium lycopersici]|uniref:Uncharacterized protein n=1 Tax=Stemphylium lycopersici TaxID=183478 RepID=A0A364MZR1_STELY|nr:hypothetical protein TW65_07414 [Stemphylium lycopersici]RAR08023.1 hypothetical protein DDE83_006195 [Stemphylium lycopersici]